MNSGRTLKTHFFRDHRTCRELTPLLWKMLSDDFDNDIPLDDHAMLIQNSAATFMFGSSVGLQEISVIDPYETEEEQYDETSSSISSLYQDEGPCKYVCPKDAFLSSSPSTSSSPSPKAKRKRKRQQTTSEDTHATKKLQSNRQLFKSKAQGDKSICHGRWSKDEDQRLVEAIQKFGAGKWKQISEIVKTRDHHQCLHRWNQTLCKKDRKLRKWTQDEDDHLISMMKIYGNRWVEIAKHVSDRTPAQCRERYCNKLDPKLNRKSWSKEEDERLLELTGIEGVGNWAKIAKVLATGRTDYLVRQRFMALIH